MYAKSIEVLEYPKILQRIASYCEFYIAEEKVYSLQPSNDYDRILNWQATVKESVKILVAHADFTIGGMRDIREPVYRAQHGGTLLPEEILDVKFSLVTVRRIKRLFEQISSDYPNLSEIVRNLPDLPGMIDTISKILSDEGEVLDSASPRLNEIRRGLKVTNENILERLQKIINNPKYTPYLQESLITQRDGRYVIPLKADFKGKIKAIVHDQSASGATLFVEPIKIVDLNNKYREYQLEERDEVRKVLHQLSLRIGESSNQLLLMMETAGELDFALACAKYAISINASAPILRRFIETAERDDQQLIRLIKARHPLLDPKTVVPIDIELSNNDRTMVITGPNTGGKTVTLKTVGLLVLMAQSGLLIPAESGSEIVVFENVLADIGDEQSIEQSLSTFSSHITNTVRILRDANEKSLVILDEVGAGTDPQEGSLLARAILSYLLDKKATTLVTTHHPELKIFAHNTPGVINASVDFDVETLQPTYHLSIGLPGRSNALLIAQRLGLPEKIIKDARSKLRSEDLSADKLLDDIREERLRMQKLRGEMEQSDKDINRIRDQLAEELKEIEDERMNILEAATRQAEEELISIKKEIEQVQRALKRANKPDDDIQELKEKIKEIEHNITEHLAPKKTTTTNIRPRNLRVGDSVAIPSLDTIGRIIDIEADLAEVQVGVMHIRVPLSDLEVQLGSKEFTPSLPRITNQHKTSILYREGIPRVEKLGKKEKKHKGKERPGFELDLRGKRADEALSALLDFLDDSFIKGYPYVRIIHGKGTGKLRGVVRNEMKTHPNVKSFEPGGENEGGEGVTIVFLEDV